MADGDVIVKIVNPPYALPNKNQGRWQIWVCAPLCRENMKIELEIKLEINSQAVKQGHEHEIETAL